MKVILPVAGKGTRLLPQTHTKPKCLVRVAGKPLLGHLIERLRGLPMEELILIVDDDKENEARIRSYMASLISVPVRYVRQLELNGPAHAVFLARDYIKGDVFIIFNDTIFDADLSSVTRTNADGLIWVKEVEDPRRFGLVVINDERIVQLVEKPETPPSNLAMVGMYYLKDGPALMQRIGQLIQANQTVQGEFYLPDPLQLMINDGYRLEAAQVDGWYDCGTIPALLDTNRRLLDSDVQTISTLGDSVIIPPVYIEQGAQLYRSIIGPYVSLAAHVEINNSIIRDSIVNEYASIQDALLHKSLIGEKAQIIGTFKSLNMGDSSALIENA